MRILFSLNSCMFRTDWLTPDLPLDESQYYRHMRPEVDIPISDEAAWSTYRYHRWMYNKMMLCDAQHIRNYPDGVPPHEYPIFMKPIINLGGMGFGAEVIHNQEEWLAPAGRPGLFCMPVLNGPQFSIDVALYNGIIRWTYAMKAHKDHLGCFTLFEHTDVPTVLQERIEDWRHDHLSGFTGVVNFEFIGEAIIECHLRMSPQFIDLYGEGWLEKVIELYEGKNVLFEESPLEGYSIPIRIYDKTPRPYHFPQNLIEQIQRTCSSIQLFTDDPNIDFNDAHSLRLAIVNSFDRKTGQAAADLLLRNLQVLP